MAHIGGTNRHKSGESSKECLQFPVHGSSISRTPFAAVHPVARYHDSSLHAVDQWAMRYKRWLGMRAQSETNIQIPQCESLIVKLIHYLFKAKPLFGDYTLGTMSHITQPLTTHSSGEPIRTSGCRKSVNHNVIDRRVLGPLLFSLYTISLRPKLTIWRLATHPGGVVIVFCVFVSVCVCVFVCARTCACV